MRARTWLSCLAMLGLGLVSVASAQQGIRWQPNLETARKLAVQTNRLILIHFWTESCQHCTRMERDVFSRSDVAAAVESNYVPVKVNTRHYPVTAQQFGITGLPADVVATPDGKVIERNVGYVPAPQYVGKLNQIAAAVRRPSGPANNTAGGFSPSPAGYSAPASTNAASAANPAGTPGYGQTAGSSGQPVPPGAQPPAQSQLASTPPWQQDSGGQRPTNGYPPYQGPQPGGNSAAAIPPQTPGTGQSGTGGIAQQPFDHSPTLRKDDPMRASDPASHGSAQPGYGRPEPSVSAGGPSAYPPGTAWQPGQDRGNPMASRAGQGSRSEGTPQSRPAGGNPPLGLDGYCSVTLFEKKQWVKGHPLYGVIHAGRTYLFAGPDEARRFYDDADRYAPVSAGNDPVLLAETGQSVAGRREHGAFYEGKVYLFSNEETRAKFEREPTRYATPPVSPPTSTARRPDNPASAVPDNGSASPGGYEFERRSPPSGDPSGASRPWAPNTRY